MNKIKNILQMILNNVKKSYKRLFLIVICIGIIVFYIVLLSNTPKTKMPGEEKVYALEDSLAGNNIITDSLEKHLEDVIEETTEAQEETEEATVIPPTVVSMYDEIAIAKVSNYVNIRKEPNVDAEIVGKIYDGAAATIIGTSILDEDWYQIKSGNVEGFIKAEYFVTGAEASKLADELACKRAVVLTQTLFVRDEPTTDSKIVGMVPIDSAYQVQQEEDEWIRVTLEDGITGWLNKEYVTIDVEFDTAISLEEEKEALEAQAMRAKQEAEEAKQKEEAKKEDTTSAEAPQESVEQSNQGDVEISKEPSEDTEENTYVNNGDLRSQIISYAQQFIGNPYVWGGNSLQTGTDCSGFVMLIYKEFGYSLSRIPNGQYSGIGETISFAECQPGDVVLYGTSSSKLTHSAIYIGDGKVIHEANRRMGVCISDAKTFGTIFACKRIIS